MSSVNPIIPPGSPLQRAHSGASSKLVVSVFAVVVVHVFLLAGLLIQGCQRQEPVIPPPEGTTVETLAPLEPLDSAPDRANTPPSTGVTVDSAPPAVPEAVPATREPFPATPPGTARTAPAPVVQDMPLPAVPPSAAPAAPAAQEMIRYTVKAGDNLTKIARNHGTTVKALRTANNLKTDRILVGQKLKVPAGQAAPIVPAPGVTPPR